MADEEVIDLPADVADVKMITPSQDEVMSGTKAAKKAPAASVDLPTHSKLAHILAIVVAGVIAVAVAIVLADGTSVIKLKDSQYLPVATDPALRSQGLNHLSLIHI